MPNEQEDWRAWNRRRQLQMCHNSYTTRQNCALADWERHEGWRTISHSLISSRNLLHFRFLHQRKWWLWLVFVAPSLAVHPQGLFSSFLWISPDHFCSFSSVAVHQPKPWSLCYKTTQKGMKNILQVTQEISLSLKKIKNKEREKSCNNEWSFNEKYCTMSLRIQRGCF